MIALLKIARLLATALCALVLFISARNFVQDPFGLVIALMLVGPLLAAMWLLPLAFGRPRTSRPVKHREGFKPDITHENIALDMGKNMLWISDPSRGERYLTLGEVLAVKTNHDWKNGTFRQRIEIQINDVKSPNWQVLFQRHSDTWIKTSKRNGEERDEWFDRIKVWAGLATIR